VNVILFGATGMVGQGVLRECLLARDVESVLSVGRSPAGQSHPKLRDITRADLFDQFVTTTERLGLGLLQIARHGTPKPVLEAADVNALTADEHT
jgi:hypothetical protein